MAKASTTGRGRPRKAQLWQSTMRHTVTISFATDRDVHTALYMAGAEASDLVVVAVRELIARRNHPAGQPDVQARAALDGLGMSDQDAGAGRPAPAAPTPTFVQPPQQQLPVTKPMPAPPAGGDVSPSAAFAYSQLDDA